MIDPLTEVVSLLKPSAPRSKGVVGAGSWRVQRTETGEPFYCAVLEGRCRLIPDGQEAVDLQAGDFVLIPANQGFEMSSASPQAALAHSLPRALGQGEFRIGPDEAPAEVRLVVGHCRFESPDAALLVSLLPRLILVSGEQRLETLVRWLKDESRDTRPAREVMIARLLEMLLIEALRAGGTTTATPGLVRGLAEPRISAALRAMHRDPAAPWTMGGLARTAALSRSSFFARFLSTVGVTPMDYLVAWRMALAKDLLLREQAGVAEVARRIGYNSSSAFSVAFTRHVGVAPGRFSRSHLGGEPSRD